MPRKKAEVAAAEPIAEPTVASIGVVKVDGTGFAYVGVAPAQDPTAETPEGLKITAANSVFIPLANVSFDPGARIKDPKTGVYYYPADGCTSWAEVALDGSYLLPR